MSDIVERLRLRAEAANSQADSVASEEHDYCASGCPCEVSGDILGEMEDWREAADEIGRLREALRFTLDWLSPVMAQHQERTIYHDICERAQKALRPADPFGKMKA